MTITWGESLYARIPMDLGLQQGLRWSTDRPSGWVTPRRRPHEESLQTLLSFHLADICQEPLQLVGTSGDVWGGADIVGLDALGQVHLFELKRTAISEKAARQLSYYLLRHVFDDPVEYVNRWWQRMERWELQVWRLAQTIAGALAGQTTHNIGLKFVQEQGGARDLTAYTWRKLSYQEKHPMLIRALLKKAETRAKGTPNAQEVRELAKMWRQRLWDETSSPHGVFACERPVVIWLAGSSFRPSAEAEIRRWRARGVDARCLQAEVCFSSQGDGLILRIAREVLPGRAELIRCLEHWAASHLPLSESPRLRLFLYNESRPSDASMKGDAGLPMDSPYAEIGVGGGETVRVSVATEGCVAE